jgi:hypothetical protein
MNIFYRPKYQSDANLFLDSLRAKDNTLAARQTQGRALLWDKPLDRDAWRDYCAARVAQQAYVYQTRAAD